VLSELCERKKYILFDLFRVSIKLFLRGSLSGTCHTLAELVNAVITMESMTNTAFCHDIFIIPLITPLTGTTDKLNVIHFLTPFPRLFSGM
jgi:hypothetical protein